MASIAEAKDILIALEMPKEQQNDTACWTLLALANLGPTDSWSKAEADCRRIHDIIVFLKDSHRKKYAENSRETFRKYVLHQFEQGGVVLLNPDDPSRPTNSPDNCYLLTPEAMDVLRAYGTSEYDASCKRFIAAKGSLAARYAGRVKKKGLSVKLSSGEQVSLSLGAHNTLQVAVIEEFAPRFIPGAQVLYLGDTKDKMRVVDTQTLRALNIDVTKHGKLPDILFYDEDRGLLCLVEVVTSHGPTSPKRHEELEKMMGKCTVRRIYVTAFPDFKEFRRHLDDIAWGTEVWLAERPDHVIHYNGPDLYVRED